MFSASSNLFISLFYFFKCRSISVNVFLLPCVNSRTGISQFQNVGLFSMFSVICYPLSLYEFYHTTLLLMSDLLYVILCLSLHWFYQSTLLLKSSIFPVICYPLFTSSLILPLDAVAYVHYVSCYLLSSISLSIDSTSGHLIMFSTHSVMLSVFFTLH